MGKSPARAIVSPSAKPWSGSHTLPPESVYEAVWPALMRYVGRAAVGTVAAGGAAVAASGEALAGEGAFVSGVVVLVPASLLDWQPISRQAMNAETNGPRVNGSNVFCSHICYLVSVFSPGETNGESKHLKSSVLSTRGPGTETPSRRCLQAVRFHAQRCPVARRLVMSTTAKAVNSVVTHTSLLAKWHQWTPTETSAKGVVSGTLWLRM